MCKCANSKEPSQFQLSRIGKFPVFGPLEIQSNEKFLTSSKKEFFKEWSKQVTYAETLNNFDPITDLGKGNFGKVFLVKNNISNQKYAMKCVKKSNLIKSKRTEHAKTEQMVLQSNNSPQALFLDFFFKDDVYLYFITPFICGGNLLYHLETFKYFDEIHSRFYVAQVILALEYLHNVNIIYRDLKPENLLLDHTGYIKLADFGLSKLLVKKTRTYTFCGTPEYLAPEIILNTGHGQACDWWCLGILTFELSVGHTPFKNRNVMKMYKNILLGRFVMPNHFTVELKDFVKHTVEVRTSFRYGNLHKGIKDIKQHKWFRLINWMALLCRKLTPPYLPRNPVCKYERVLNSSLSTVLREKESNTSAETNKKNGEVFDL